VEKEAPPRVQRTQVASSNIQSIGYHPPTQTLEVEFLSGRIYQYFDVPETVYQAFMEASSKGRFLASGIKGAYRYARL